ncbi:hypothetical protein [Thiomonas sp. OC7]|uniref:hypothetical protein n=1 Tax=unclassified Thiomonas TaxID=2625466 RepID=UPI0012A7E9D4|nr:protein of unknown function [Thiomonas sp. Bio17B3]VDY10690.1 protein of unknown function [Thiomonas sp. Sup16B3]VDY14274.1 protein of unknown function [Thiomonas sp. OC7]VDY16530.1 protein of unknown function [Thiomonas sp. CB2]
MSALALFNRVLDRLEETLIAILMAAATLLIFVAVVYRYMAGFAIPGCAFQRSWTPVSV